MRRRQRMQDVAVLGYHDIDDDDDDDDVLGFSWGGAANMLLNPFAQAQALGLPVPQGLVALGDPLGPMKAAQAVYETVRGKGGSKRAAKAAAQVAAQAIPQAAAGGQMAGGGFTPPLQALPQMYGAPGNAGGTRYDSQAPWAGPARREVVGLGAQTMGSAATTVSFSTNNIGKPIRVERLLIQVTDVGAVAAGAETVDILQIGVDSQLAGALGNPIEAFGSTAQSGVVLAGGWWYPGVTLTLTINRTAAPGGTTTVVYTASIFGETPRSNAWTPFGVQG